MRDETAVFDAKRSAKSRGRSPARHYTPRGELRHYGRPIEYLTEDEYSALAFEADHPEHRLLMRLMWETGVRISEALALRYGDVYPDGLNIRRGKGDKQRFIPCQAPILGELLRYRETHRKDHIFQRVSTESGALLMLRRYAKRCGITKRVFPHIFRHSFAINFIRQTGNPFALQDIGGWSDMEAVKIYMRLTKEGPREAIGKMSFPIV